jgi:putative cardiolipin synthase
VSACCFTTTKALCRAGRRFGAVALSLLLCACGGLPPQVERPVSKAERPASDSPLAQIAGRSVPEPGLTGFRLMPLGSYALDARIQLADRARHSLDVQYYVIEDDRTGRLLMRHLRDAALRGVRVRLLVDDLYTSGADAMFQGLAAYPNVEVRLFNPFCCARGSLLGKYVASLADFGRLNHRMHNKLFMADGAMAVMGGRNIADEYFTRSTTSNFVDMDVLVVGAATGRLASIFDAYWNSAQAYPVESIAGRIDADVARAAFDHRVDDGDQMTTVDLPATDILGYGPIRDDLDAGQLGLVWGTAVAFADPPAKVMATSPERARAMSVQMDVMDRVVLSKRDVLLVSPYFVPGRKGTEAFAALTGRGVKVTILTNSLAATDEPLVHAGYARYREALLRSDVDLYELSPTRIRQNLRLLLPGRSLGRLHAKTAVIDATTVYIGSMNLDPRSDSTNTELGILAECPELAREVLRVVDISKRRSAYQVRFAPGSGRLEWLAVDADDRETVLSEEPEVSPLTRLRNLLFGQVVPEQLL